PNRGPADGLAIKEPLQGGEWIVRRNPMRVGSSSDWYPHSLRCIHRRNTASSLGAVLLQKLISAEIHRILNSPTHAKRFHSLQTLFGRVVEMRDRPSQSAYWNFLIQLLEEPEEFVDGCIAVPMHRQCHALLSCPLDDFVIAILLRLRGLLVVVHVPGDALADTVELQHIVAEAHRQQPRQILVLFKLLARRLSVQ